VCIGEETVSSAEGLRLARLAKEIDPRTIVIAGGVYFSYAVDETFADGNVDYIVRGEGEETLSELIQALREDADSLAWIRGLCYEEGGQVRKNPLRPPVSNLDALPWPAYDLLTVAEYGRGSKNHPALASLEHSRGCTGRCSFCILWKQFGAPNNGEVVPCYRTKSPERSFDEVKWLVTKYGRKTIHFVDPCFNTDPQWTDRFADLMLRSGLNVQFTAWMRADFVLRDESLGILEKLVRAGLIQTYIGIERMDERELAFLDRGHNAPDVTRKAFEIFRERYSGVFTIGTVVYGLPWESKQTLAALRDFQYSWPVDYVFYIPLAPNPGTEIRKYLQTHGYRVSGNFREYNFFTPVVDTDHLTRGDLEDFYSDMLVYFSLAKLRSIFRGYAKSPRSRHRRVHNRLVWYGLKVGARQLTRRLLRGLVRGPTLYAQKPKWYDA